MAKTVDGETTRKLVISVPKIANGQFYFNLSSKTWSHVFFWNTVYVCLNTICQVAARALLSHLLSTQRLGRRRCALHCLLCFVSTER